MKCPTSAVRSERSLFRAIGLDRCALVLCFLNAALASSPAAGQVSTAAAKPAPVDHEATAFVQELLAQRPAQELSIDGTFQIRQSDGQRSRIPVKYSVRISESTWQSVYATEATPSRGAETLVILHQAAQPNRYLYSQVSLDGARTNSVTLTGAEAGVPFASSDFWLSDLGLEVLHWPQQRLIRDAKITMRWGRPCKVLESTNPHPGEGRYARVVSWIDSELGSLNRAEAFDTRGKHFKTFDLRSFKKVNGRWQVKDMELENERNDSRTRLEFIFESP